MLNVIKDVLFLFHQFLNLAWVLNNIFDLISLLWFTEDGEPTHHSTPGYSDSAEVYK